MKYIVFISLALCLLGCKTSNIEIVKLNEVQENLAYLASDELQGRNTGSKGIEKAAQYIEKIFKANSIKPYFETYRDSFNLENTVGYNIIGFLEGNDPKLKKEVVILGAHYDHIGIIKEINGDSIANGANDNGAGTTTILELAKQFSKKKSNKRSLLFTLFSAEEKGLVGSQHLADKLFNKKLNLYTMVNFEMVGVPLKDRDYLAFVSGYDLSNMASKLNEYVGKNLIGFSEISKKYNLFRQSDNATFYDVFKVPCQTISTCDLSNYDYYHHVDDEADKMDFEHMTNFINKMIPALEAMINAPTREIKLYD